MVRYGFEAASGHQMEALRIARGNSNARRRIGGTPIAGDMNQSGRRMRRIADRRRRIGGTPIAGVFSRTKKLALFLLCINISRCGLSVFFAD